MGVSFEVGQVALFTNKSEATVGSYDLSIDMLPKIAGSNPSGMLAIQILFPLKKSILQCAAA